MKVMLVVAQGVHTGKIIPITAAEFLIGRDPHCQLRPASPSISKQHCGLFIRDDKIFVKDYGSTNGTCINGEQVAGEREVSHGDKLKIGPLEFEIAIDKTASRPTIKIVPKQTTVAAAPAPAAAPVAVAAVEPAAASAPAAGSSEESEDAAAMLLSMDENSGTDGTTEGKIPDGTTVMDIPAVDAQGDASKKAKLAQADTSKAAAELLSKYMRRPRA
jgi:predicted component of type VI protein secretion system